MKINQRISGQSLVEFALIIPIVFFLITGFFDLGKAVSNYTTLTNAVREATRYAIVHKADLTDAFNNFPPPKTNALQVKVMENALGMTLNRDDIRVTVVKNAKGQYTTVSIEAIYRYQPVTPGMKALLGTDGINIRAYSKMTVAPRSK